ncbi:PepSY domain-containing protein [Paraburkholderia sp. 40]|uniref:PepSY domain-containing protein n=1 Tax=Paraburkholderia sp. 40 TaxID=2991059 RepID=UPI003D228042
MYRYTKLSLLAIAIATTGAVAYAAKGGMEIDALAISKAKIPLTQAVTVAEQHANGKASRAEYENSKQGWVYDVEVVSGAKVFDVRVDPDKGTVISSAEDKGITMTTTTSKTDTASVAGSRVTRRSGPETSWNISIKHSFYGSTRLNTRMPSC